MIEPAKMADYKGQAPAVLVYGPSGGGKTYFATMRIWGRVFVLDFDKGLATAKTAPNRGTIEYLPHVSSTPVSWGMTSEILQFLVQQGKQRYDTVVIDTATAAEDNFYDDLVVSQGKTNSDDHRTVYRALKHQMLSMLSDLRKLGLNLVVTAGDRGIKDKTGNVISIQPDFSGTTSAEAPRAFDEVYYLKCIGARKSGSDPNGPERPVYKCFTSSDGTFWAKSRWQVPESEDYEFVVSQLMKKLQAAQGPKAA